MNRSLVGEMIGAQSVIERLNKKGILVSIDYQVDGTYSLTMLTQSNLSESCWEVEHSSWNVTNLYDALTEGESKLTAKEK